MTNPHDGASPGANRVTSLGSALMQGAMIGQLAVGTFADAMGLGLTLFVFGESAKMLD